MTAELQFLEAWIPEKMEPGTVFLLEGPNSLGHGNNPFVAVLACPGCGTVGLITRRQLHGFGDVHSRVGGQLRSHASRHR